MKKLTKNQMYLNMLKKGNTKTLQSYLEDDCLKEYSFKKFLKEFFNKYNTSIHGYFSINNNMFICDNYSLIRISNSKQKIEILKNYKELSNDNSIIPVIKQMFQDFEKNTHEITKINIFDYVNMNNFSDVSSTVYLQISDTQEIKINMLKLFMLSSVIGDKNIKIILPKKTTEGLWIVDHIGNSIGFILPIR